MRRVGLDMRAPKGCIVDFWAVHVDVACTACHVRWSYFWQLGLSSIVRPLFGRSEGKMRGSMGSEEFAREVSCQVLVLCFVDVMAPFTCLQHEKVSIGDI